MSAFDKIDGAVVALRGHAARHHVASSIHIAIADTINLLLELQAEHQRTQDEKAGEQE